jgi:hypothetical protein
VSDFQTTDQTREQLDGRTLRLVDARSTKTDRPLGLIFVDVRSGDLLSIFVVSGALDAEVVPVSDEARDEIRRSLRGMAEGMTDRPDDFASILAMNVRNALERFHAADEDDMIEGLDDTAMAKVNPAIRRAIYEVIVAVNAAASGDKDAAVKLNFLAQMVPSEWERASDLPASDVF